MVLEEESPDRWYQYQQESYESQKMWTLEKFEVDRKY